MKFLVVVGLVAMGVAGGCADVQQHTQSSRPLDKLASVSVGDVMVKVDVSENLPNIAGKSDIFGRQRNKGFSEIRYMGLAPDGKAVFRRRDVEIMTDETTMNRSHVSVTQAQATVSGNTAYGTGVTVGNRGPNVAPLPPDTIEFALDLKVERSLTLQDKTVEVVEATPASVKFVVR